MSKLLLILLATLLCLNAAAGTSLPRDTTLPTMVNMLARHSNDLGARVRTGTLSEKQATETLVKLVSRLRYTREEGPGAFFIMTANRTMPCMIAMPTMPQLVGKELDDPRYECAIKTKSNIFAQLANQCTDNQVGHVEYQWRPTPHSQARKMWLYGRLVRDLGWVIGVSDYAPPKGPGPELSVKGRQALARLRHATMFEDSAVGFGGETPRVVYAYWDLLEEPNADAAFKQLLRTGTPSGQLYALCGIYHTDREHLAAAAKPFLNSDDSVFTFSGCLQSASSIPKMTRDILSGSWPRSLGRP